MSRRCAALRNLLRRHRPQWWRRAWAQWVPARIRSFNRAASLPLAVVFLFGSRRIRREYGMTWRRRFALAVRMYWNTRQVETGTSYKAHLTMAVKLLEIPSDVKGDVVECGCYRGGSTANLSLACRLVGRRLIAYDSFEGLPAPTPGDRYASAEMEGAYSADLDQVRRNVERLGAIEVCEFRRGWFAETLPHHDSPIVLGFLDVDYQASLDTCVTNLWPHLTPRGYLFIDEYLRLDYCALFFSESFWAERFDAKPPGLIGAGSGVGVGEYYVGPRDERAPVQGPGSIAYTRRDFTGHWDFEPPSNDS